MKKIISLAVCFVMPFVLMGAKTAEDTPPTTSAQAFVLYCPDNNTVICSKNADEKMKPASTTKIMTSLITLEEAASCNSEVTFKQEMVAEGSSMYLKVGEKVRLSDLASGMMMASGNDAANAAAYTISGSPEKFSQRMNEKAKQIGMTNTNFVTPSGLDDDNHYSSAKDMALLMSYALENDDFANLTAKKSVTVEFLEPKSKKTAYANHNRLLSLYPYCTGGKTGYTDGAGRCIVYFIDTDDIRAVAVLLGCPSSNDRVKDSVKLLRYITDNYKTYTLIKRGTLVDNFAVEKGRRLSINAIVDNDICVTLKKSECADVHTSYTRSGAEGLSAEGFPLVQAPVGYSDVLGVLWVKCGTSCTLSIEVTAESSVLRKTYTDHLGDMINTLPYVFG